MFVAILPYVLRQINAEIEIDKISHYLASDGFEFSMGCLDAPSLIPSGSLEQIPLYSDSHIGMVYGARQRCILRSLF